MCGDHKDSDNQNVEELGSPPHVRGPLDVSLQDVGCIGITPACAGTTKGELG